MTDSYHRQMKDEEGRKNASVEALNMAKKNIQELKKKLNEEKRERKFAAAALANAAT